jgi:hypothetical protein
MMEDAQKKAKWAGMPIADVKLVMMASVAVLAAQHFPRKWMIGRAYRPLTARGEPGRLPSVLPTSNASTNSRLLGGGEPLGGANATIPAPAASIDRLGTALNNLALVAANNMTVLQQLMVANLALTALVTMLTAANKKLAEALAKAKGGPAPAAMPSTPGAACSTNSPFPSNYCWTHGHRCSQHHTSATCGNKAKGHKDMARTSNMMGGSDANKGWNTRT